MGSFYEDTKRLLEDCELFITEILQDESLSQQASEARETLLHNFHVVHSRNPLDFPSRWDTRQEESSDDNQSVGVGRSVPSDDVSVASDYQDEGPQEYFEEIPLVAVQELNNILKQGYLEKKRRDHSFFGSEWQRRWCVLNNTIFYYFGSDKEKQQKGCFYINGYSAELATNLRKDSKKNACFVLKAPDQRPYQFTASSPQEARDWVDQINFVLKDLSSNFIPFDDEEEDGECEVEDTYDDIETTNSQGTARPVLHPSIHSASSQEDWKSSRLGDDEDEEDDIYEVLPEDDFPDPLDDTGEKASKSEWSTDYASYYQGLWDCEADEPDELTFRRGDLIHIISKEYNIHGWWVGKLNGNIGIVPKDFLQRAYIV
ncbi:src kinase-associated phosphoprotein 1 isoform X1 [Brienomyrus brachyistius]|uniref:src kinase-associated phosphoprotein 1 isoform X1 n=1 Tax=Brienomyrus brachyistius TaxID=42636 RepID=UPI0020B1D62B|nr:src kinase-associated phosphoprotein 1 isoform X1 [Brienomyrus brachyistius]